MKITILEILGEDNNWEWYTVFKNSVFTPRQAIKQHLEDQHEHDGDQPEPENIIESTGGYFYAEYTDVRAISYKI